MAEETKTATEPAPAEEPKKGGKKGGKKDETPIEELFDLSKPIPRVSNDL